MYEVPHNLDGTELGNNARVALLWELFHMISTYDFEGSYFETFESVPMSSFLKLMYI